MGKETKSRTEKESWIEERILGLGDHYKTTISGGGKKSEGRGRTSEEAERIAKDKWNKKK
jgi:hypothetical protein